MTAKVEILTPAARAPRVASPQAPAVREGILELAGSRTLHHHGRLEDVRIAWRMTGPAEAPVVCALGGISAHRRVCLANDARGGWWSEIAGPGKPLDSDRWRILGFDFLGGSGESTGPAAGDSAFPSISTYDQARALEQLLDALGIGALRAIAGGSYGGMVGMAFAERYPDRVANLLVIGAADRAHPMSTAWRSSQRRIVRFAIEVGQAARGMELARALAMTSYRSAEEFAARFDGPAQLVEGRFEFPVEQYLAARGRDYAAHHRPEAFLCLSESIDLHRVDVARIFVPTTVVGIREDRLVPLPDIRAMVARLQQGRLHELSSVFGHDAFLKETDQLRGIFANVLGGAA
ncbi:MAG TPA: homoserine O-succinyltransferase [Steroidobacteraceae bacterium]|nr:homoserine O-succinyltransferase [Steroidobacteraceae bacterium]